MSGEAHLLLHRKSSPQRDRGMAIAIPNIPKVTDERARMKLMCDYDKYEPELFKHHIGTPETTRTIGMKLVPSDFDRRVPSRDELTIAEREWEARRTRRISTKKRSTTVSFIARLHGNDRAPPNKGQGAAEEHVAAPKDDVNQRKPNQTHAFQKSTRVSVQDTLSSLHSNWNGSSYEQGMSITSSLSPAPRLMTAEGKPCTVRQAPLESLSQRSTQQVSSLPSLTAGAAGAGGAGGAGGAESTTIRWKQNLHTKRSAVEESGEGRPTQQQMLRPRVPSPRPAPAPLLSPKDDDALSRGPSKSLFMKRDLTWSAEHCAKLLRVILNTPPEYSMSFNLDLRSIDLNWMRGAHYPRSFVSLQSWHPGEGRVDHEDGGVAVPVLNSPRSVLVLLHSGVVVADLMPFGTCDDDDDDPALPQERELRRKVKRMRWERRARSCESLLESLRAEHLSLCCNVNLADLLKAFHAEGKQVESMELPTSICIDHQRRERILESARKQVDRQLMFAKDVFERQLKAEERKRIAEEEAQERLNRKKKDAELARQQAAERLAAQRKKTAEMEELYKLSLQQRLLSAERKNALRIEAQRRRRELRQLERQRLAAERQERLDRVAQAKENEKHALQQKYEEKEKRMMQLFEEQELKRKAMREKILARAAKSEELAELVRQRAVMQEERVRQAAMDQQQKAEERLLQLQQLREEDRARRAKEESKKRQHLKDVFDTVTKKLLANRTEMLENQGERERRQNERKQQQQTEAMERHERERAEMESKAYALLRNRRATEFTKVEKILHLLAKSEAVGFLESQRKRLLQETQKTRLALMAERDALKQQMLQETHTLPR